ncbi:MAG: DUF1579 domain-containing protein [Phycisphaerales bacterium]|nr:DUF1579 domain-containing protein [Phycisphaerales bacterium]
MKTRSCCLSVAALVALAGSITLAQPAKETKPVKPSATPSQPAVKPGGQPAGMPQMTEQQAKDMQACMEAGIPGSQHQHLAKAVGTWNGKSKMWMAPNTEAITSDTKTVVTSIMDGRFTKCETSGEIPGMGPFFGSGVYGFDNVSQKFQSTWIDNCGTGMMTGTGELSSDGTTMTWTFNYNCPVTKKPTTMREVERWTGKDSMVLEMYAIEPHSGKEFKMMEITSTRDASKSTAVVPTNNAK